VSEQTTPPDRPGLLRRLAAGAWHVPAGFVLLARHPRLWPLALLPVAAAFVLVMAGAVAGAFAVPRLQSLVLPEPGRGPEWLVLLAMIGLWVGTVCAGMAFGLAIALFLTAPLLDLLSARVEGLLRGEVPGRSRGFGWEVLQALRGAVYFLAAAPLIFAVSLIPIAGPVLGAVWAGRALAFQLTDGPLTRRGLAFRDKRAWHRAWRAESQGFGLAGVVTLLVPLANFLLAPALAAGGTLLVMGLEPAVTAAPVAPPPSAAGEEPATPTVEGA
jgi:uncharacterized protein involved in cysteine biosynthesis